MTAQPPFIPLAVPVIGEEERANLMACVDTEMVSTVGPFVSEFEGRLAEVCEAPDALAVAAGTMGLHAALHALGVRPGDLVMLPSFTFIASANAVAQCGATPWLIDIDPASWTMDAAVLERELAEWTERRGGATIHRPTGRRVAAIMPVYTLGTPADMEPINRIAGEHGLPVVADAAAALGARYRGDPINEWADATVYSFNGNKTITTGGGGGITTRDPELAARLRHITTTARVGRDYDHDQVGFNYRMTNLEAAVGCAQIEKLDRFLEAKRATRRAYDEAFADLGCAAPFPVPDWGTSAYWFSGVVLSPDAPIDAPGLVGGLNERQIGARPFWKPVHMQPPYRDAPRSPMLQSEDLWHRIVTLPVSTSLSDGDRDRVTSAVREVLGARVAQAA